MIHSTFQFPVHLKLDAPWSCNWGHADSSIFSHLWRIGFDFPCYIINEIITPAFIVLPPVTFCIVRWQPHFMLICVVYDETNLFLTGPGYNKAPNNKVKY